MLVGGSTRIPLVRRLVGELFGRTPHSELNPDEVVALGAAVQADILVTGNREMLLLDVTPLSLGIETMGGVMSKIILRNSTIPATGSEMFTTGVDNQTAVDIHVLQGERELVADNRSLARFKLRGIPPMPAGLPRVQVQFQIDANGILSVTAHELRTDIEQTIEVKPSYGLTDEEVERMLLESFEHAEADFAARLLIEARNEAETVIAATEKSLRSPDFAAIARRAPSRAAAAHRIGAGRSERRHGVGRSRAHSRKDARAERRHAAPGGGDDESLGAGRAVGKKRQRSVVDDIRSGRLHRRKRPPEGGRYVEAHMPKVTFIIDGEPDGRVRARQAAVLAPRQARIVSRRREALRSRLEHACGGSCACTTCHVIIREGAQNLSEMQDDELDRLDTAWDLTTRFAPRLSGGDQRRRRLRAADVHAELRAGRRRHPARQVGQEGSQGRGGGAVKWIDAEDIGIALTEKFPGVDPLTVRFTDLRDRVLALDGFDDDPKTSNEPKLEAIQMAWYEEWKDAQES